MGHSWKKATFFKSERMLQSLLRIHSRRLFYSGGSKIDKAVRFFLLMDGVFIFDFESGHSYVIARSKVLWGVHDLGWF